MEYVVSAAVDRRGERRCRLEARSMLETDLSTRSADREAMVDECGLFRMECVMLMKSYRPLAEQLSGEAAVYTEVP